MQRHAHLSPLAGKANPNSAHKLPLPRDEQQPQIIAEKERGGMGFARLELPDSSRTCRR